MRTALNVFASTIGVHMKNTFARPMFQVVLFVQPFVVTTTTHMVYRDSDVGNLAVYVVLGGGLAGIWSALTFSSAGDINRERYYGTLQPMLAAPTRLPLIFSAKITANALLSLTSLGISLLYSWLLLGVGLGVPHWPASLSALAAFLFSANAFALCLSTTFLLSRSTAIMQNFLEYPLLLLGAIAFPISTLPPWARGLSAILPMRWGSEALRLSLDSKALDSRFWGALGWAALTGAAYYALALLLFVRVEHRVRREATLELA
jgi:ABC-2 type transport system permease protein